jgi:hypothetical protein
MIWHIVVMVKNEEVKSEEFVTSSTTSDTKTKELLPTVV